MEEDEMFDEPDPQFAGGSVTAPPAYVQQAAQVAAPPRYQGADPVLANPEFQRFIPPGFTGTRYQLPYENQQALHDYVTYKADKEAEDQNYVRDIVRHGKIEDSFKAVQAAKRFIGQRRFSSDCTRTHPIFSLAVRVRCRVRSDPCARSHRLRCWEVSRWCLIPRLESESEYRITLERVMFNW
jgi:hypothetical protein